MAGSSELVLRTRCDHGNAGKCSYVYDAGDACFECPGGSEVVLDPDMVFTIGGPASRHRMEYDAVTYVEVTAADVLDALEKP